MSGMELNKIIASILLASLCVMVVGTVVNAIYKPKLHPAQRGYKVATHHKTLQTDASESVESAKEIDIKVLMSKANAEAGGKIIKKCTVCHTIESGGADKVGPNLWNLLKRPKASVSTYTYSNAMKAAGGNWDYADLFAFLSKPKQFIPGTKMSFAGLKPEDIANVVEFLRTNVHDGEVALP